MNNSYFNEYIRTFTLDLDKILDNEKFDYNLKTLEVIKLFFNLLYHLTFQQNQLFPSNYARWVYLVNLYELPVSSANFITKLNNLKRKASKYNIIKENDFKQLINQIRNYLAIFSNEESEFIEYVKDENTEILQTESNLYSFKAIVLDKRIKTNSSPIKVLICLTEDFGKVFIKLNKKYDYIYNIVEKNSSLKFVDLIEYNIQNKAFEVTENSYITFEPDMLIDITGIADCFTFYEINPLLSILNLLTLRNDSNYYTLRGNVVNSIFDDLVSKACVDFETSFNKSLKIKPIRLLLLDDEKMIDKLKDETKNHFNVISNNVAKLPYGLLFIEPSFISYDFGIQGRLDLLIQSNEDERLKEVVELKSGNAPNSNLKLTIDYKQLYLNTWHNHSAQANGYNLLLESVFNKRKGNSSIFYSSDLYTPIRNVVNELKIKQEFIKTRNLIAHFLIKFSKNEIDLFEKLERTKFKDNLSEKKRTNFLLSIKELDTNEIKYFKAGIRFIIREEIYNKLNLQNNGENYSKLNFTFDEKLEKFSVLNNLKLIIEQSNLDLLHLYFEFPDNSENINFFRKGDQCIVYPNEVSDDPTKFYIFKGFIAEITNQGITISLLNKSLNLFLLKTYDHWVIEVDRSDSLVRKQLSSFLNFVNAPKRMKNLILGIQRPTFLDAKLPEFGYLNSISQKIFEQAINAQDYFLIQGPPGTGKTSRMLKALVEYYYKYSTKKILICAYTNRAVDEICSVLETINENFPYIRISSKDAGKQNHKSLPYLSEILTLEALKEIIENTRFYISTVSSLYTTNEIFELVKFDILILDEASQVLETQIVGIISKVDKFILIGDEKQLPAIVLQNEEMPEKSENNLKSFSHSLLSKLLKNARENDWTEVYSTLTQQGRMNKKIQDLANYLFYDGQLQVIEDNYNQIKEFSDYIYDYDEFLKSVLSDRVVFVNTPAEQNVKFNKFEVNFIAKFVEKFVSFNKENFTNQTIGIISPFRLQCREIIKRIPENYQNSILVDTVERYQGSERDVIILSMGTNYGTLLKMVSNEIEIDNKIIDRKLNVAITRAKEHLIILGNEQLLSNSTVYSNLIKWIKQNGKIIT